MLIAVFTRLGGGWRSGYFNISLVQFALVLTSGRTGQMDRDGA